MFPATSYVTLCSRLLPASTLIGVVVPLCTTWVIFPNASYPYVSVPITPLFTVALTSRLAVSYRYVFVWL